LQGGIRTATLNVKNSDNDSEESPSAQGMSSKPKTPAPVPLYPQVQVSSGGASELHKRQDSNSLKQGQKKRRKTRPALPTPRLRLLSHLLQMSDILSLREHLSPVKKQECTVRCYSTA
jgi:hypothetical protein